MKIEVRKFDPSALADAFVQPSRDNPLWGLAAREILNGIIVNLQKTHDNLEAASEWENELDALGVNNSVGKYLEMLDKAPEISSSKQALTHHIQQIMSA